MTVLNDPGPAGHKMQIQQVIERDRHSGRYALCECGWLGPWRQTLNDALDDADGHRTEIAPEPLRDQTAMNAIHALLDRAEWSSTTLDDIAAIVRATGREIREPGD